MEIVFNKFPNPKEEHMGSALARASGGSGGTGEDEEIKTEPCTLNSEPLYTEPQTLYPEPQFQYPEPPIP